MAGEVAAPALHSFPSGHTVIVVSVYGFMAYLWFRAAHSFWEKGVVAIAFLIFASQVISARLVLGAHWPSDVVVGLVIGMMLLTTVILAYNRAEAVLHQRRVSLEPEAKRPDSR